MYSLERNVAVKQTKKKLSLHLANEVFASLKMAIAECYVKLMNIRDCPMFNYHPIEKIKHTALLLIV